MTKFLSALTANPWLTICLAALYFAAVVLPHDIVGGKIYAYLFHGSIPEYNKTFFAIVSLCVLFVVAGIFRKLRESAGLTLRLLCLLSLLVLMVTSYLSIMVLATETIHWFQYAVMSILLFPLVRNYADTLIWTTILGAIDEGYQYFALVTSDYYDFNDVILNFFGAVLGLWILSLYVEKAPRIRKFPAFTPAVLSFLFLLVAGGLAVATGTVTVYGPAEHGSLLTLIPEKPPGFWSSFHMYRYHIVLPLQALFTLFLLYHFYRILLGRMTSKQDVTVSTV